MDQEFKDKRNFDYFDKYTFLCEMYDEHTHEIREMILNFFPFDESIQVIDAEKGKNLVRRVQCPTVTVNMLKIGNTVNVFSKLLHIVDCAPHTRQNFLKNVESTFALIKPVNPEKHGKIMTFIAAKGFRIVQMKNGRMDKDMAAEMYKDLTGQGMMPLIINYVTSDAVIGIELEAPNAVAEWRKALGATDPAYAKPGTLRALLGEDILRNVAHGCNTKENAQLMIQLFFGTKTSPARVPTSATLKDCTCCVIKPHVLVDGNVGHIIEQIATSEKFCVSAISMFSVDITNAREFFEIYDGVLPEFQHMCHHLAEGKCIVLEVKLKQGIKDCNVVCEFRKLCGHRDPDFSRQLYPDTIRARFGKDIVHNAVHCTDLPEDGELEVEYFFKLLANEGEK